MADQMQKKEFPSNIMEMQFPFKLASETMGHIQ